MILALVMALALVACGNKNTDDGKKDNPDDNKTPTVITNPDKVQDEMTSSDGKYEVAFVTDVGQLKDKSFNQGTYDGVSCTPPTTACPTSTISPPTAVRPPMMTASPL